MKRLFVRATLSLASIGLLTACGAQKGLQPKPGMAAVPVAHGAERAKTPDELMRPSSQAWPDHSAETIGRSVERQPDPFNLPPS